MLIFNNADDDNDEEGADDNDTCADVCPHVHLQPPQPARPGLEYHEIDLQYFITEPYHTIDLTFTFTNLFSVQVLVHGALRGRRHLGHECLKDYNR